MTKIDLMEKTGQMNGNRTFLISAAFLIIGFFIILIIANRGKVEVVNTRLTKIPFKIGIWNGRDIDMEQRVVDILSTDVYVNRIYYAKGFDSTVLKLYIGYYGTEKGGRTGHNPMACLPSQGWTVIENKDVAVKILVKKENEKVVFLNRLLAKKGGFKKIIYHWYQSSGDMVISNGVEQNLDRFFKRIVLNRCDGAYIEVSSDFNNYRKIDDEIIQDFIKELFPLLIAYWPVEKNLS